jgi:hypothetical protein
MSIFKFAECGSRMWKHKLVAAGKLGGNTSSEEEEGEFTSDAAPSPPGLRKASSSGGTGAGAGQGTHIGDATGIHRSPSMGGTPPPSPPWRIPFFSQQQIILQKQSTTVFSVGQHRWARSCWSRRRSASSRLNETAENELE